VRAPVLGDDVHAGLHEVRAEVGDLLLGYLHLLETGGDLFKGQVPPLAALERE
jgi:hypothetical protein